MKDSLRSYRKRFRSWKDSGRLHREGVRYERVFRVRHLSIPNEADIRKRLKVRFPTLRAKSKGDLCIAAVYRHYNWENGSLKPSLERFGDVLHYDWSETHNCHGSEWSRSVKKKMNDDLVATLMRWIQAYSIDVVFSYLSGENVTPGTVQNMRELGIPMINMFLNDKEGFVGKIRNGQSMGSRDICRHFDLCWTSTEDALKKYCVEGALPIYLPEGANPNLHRPFDIEKDVDVSFVGQCYGRRPEVIRRLGLEGIHVEAYGQGWPNGPLSADEMIRLYSRSKINLGFGGVGSLKETRCLKGRDFEVPMSGGLYVTEYHPELARWYDLGREIVTYSNLGELIRIIRHFLSHPEEAEAIRKAGFRRARKEHSWEMRFQTIFNLMGLLV